jgi:hypothetical protein
MLYLVGAEHGLIRPSDSGDLMSPHGLAPHALSIGLFDSSVSWILKSIFTLRFMTFTPTLWQCKLRDAHEGTLAMCGAESVGVGEEGVHGCSRVKMLFGFNISKLL